MKILFFLGLSNPFPGGGWSRVSSFASHFQNKGNDVVVVGTFSFKNLSKAGSLNWNGIRIYNLVPSFENELFNILSSIIVSPLVFLFLRPNLVIISVAPGPPALGGFLAAKISRAKIIFDYGDIWEDSIILMAKPNYQKKIFEFLKALMNSIYLKSDLMVSVTPNLVRYLNFRGISNVKYIPNGADTSIFKPYDKIDVRRKIGLAENDFIIVFQGGAYPGSLYRLDIVVKAMSRLLDEIKLKLLMIGEIRDKKVFNAVDKQGNYIYLGIIENPRDLARYLSAADIGIISFDNVPYTKDTLPVKFFEYCACGMPVVAMTYDESILAKLIRKNNVGLTCKPLDTKELEKILKGIYYDKVFRERAGKKARLMVEQYFDRRKIAERLDKLVKSINN